jgi:hypothetical protein
LTVYTKVLTPPEKVVKALRSASEFGDYDAEDIKRERRLDSRFAERVTLEVVLELQQQVVKLAEQLQDMRENPPKRTFFG